MKERPILFSGPMVRTILEGRKTQTRRIINGVNENPLLNKISWRDDGFYWDEGNGCYFRIKCPYGQLSDRLWVRETWRCFGGREYEYQQDQKQMIYRASDGIQPNESEGDWRPSIHMPRWASRIDLEVVKVRVERLQDISEEDAKAEGVQEGYDFPGLEKAVMYGDITKQPKEFAGFWECRKEQISKLNQQTIDRATNPPIVKSFKIGFRETWAKIYKRESWDNNPWVWVVEFKRIQP